MKKLSQAIVLAGAMTAGLVTVQTAQAEVSMAVDLATEYVFRGIIQGPGEAMVAGTVAYEHESGLYGTLWVTSGVAGSQEYDAIVGFAGEAGGLGYDVGYISYIYPDMDGVDKLDDFSEFYVGLSYDLASLYVYKNTDTDANGDYLYAALGLDFDPVSVTIGNQSNADANDYTHVDISWAYNDQVSLTYSKIVDAATDYEDGGYDRTGRFVVSYSLPIEM